MLLSNRSVAFSLVMLIAAPTMAAAEGATATPDFSRYPCPVLSHVGIALVGFEQQRSGDYILTFSIPRDMSGYFRGYIFEVRDSSQKLLTIVRGSDAIVQKDTEASAVRTLGFRTDQPISTEITVFETYPSGGCKFYDVDLGRAKLETAGKPSRE
jgi:hypothetical protein